MSHNIEMWKSKKKSKWIKSDESWISRVLNFLKFLNHDYISRKDWTRY